METPFSVSPRIPFLRSAHKTLIGLSKTFRYAHQRKNFIALTKSIIAQGSPLLSRIADVDHTTAAWDKRLAHFLKVSTQPDTLKEAYRSFVSKHVNDIIYVSIDWTALVKKGTCFEDECRVYDSRDQRTHDGFPLLLATGCDRAAKKWLPLMWTLGSWVAEDFKSENHYTTTLITELVAWLCTATKTKTRIFLADRGFAREPIIATFVRLKQYFVVHLRDNMWATLNNGVRIKLMDLQRGDYPDVRLMAWNCTVRVVVCCYAKERRVLITNLPIETHDAQAVHRAYSIRGKIESNIKEIKQGFGLERFRVRSFAAIENMIACIMLAYTITHLLLLKFRSFCMRIRRKLFRYRSKPGRMTIDLVRRLVQRVLLHGCSPVISKILAVYS